MPVLFILLAISFTVNAIPANNDGARQKREINKIFEVNFPPALIENTASLFISESNESADNSDSDTSSSDSTIRSATKPSSQSKSKLVSPKMKNSTNSLPAGITTKSAETEKQAKVLTGSGRESSVRRKRNVPGFINIFNNGIRDVDEVANRAYNELANFDQTGEKNFVGWGSHASQNIANMFPVNSPPAESAPPANSVSNS